MQRIIKNRTDLLAIFLLGFMAIFVLRLFWLQVVNYGEYVTIAKTTQQRSFVLPASRGEIYMMDNGIAVPVVLNQTVYTVFADPETVKSGDVDDIEKALRDEAGGEVTGDIKAKLNKDNSRYEILAKNISRTQAEKLKKHDFSGIGFQQGTVRNYPEGSLGAQVLGFVNTENKGQYGVEQQLNERLSGRDGLLQSVTDVKNVPLNVGKDNVRIEAKSGDNVALTIDRNIQSYAEEALKRGVEQAGATEGSVLIMDPSNGQVLADANYPTYNPSEYYNAKDAAVFVDNTTMTPFEPGSIIKSFTIPTALDKGAITPSSSYVNTDCIRVADRTMCNVLRGIGGVVDVQGVLTNSLNVGTISFARRLGDGSSINRQARDTIYDYFHNKFGFGEKTGIEVGEAQGIIYSPETTEGNEVQYSAMAYGQSMNLTMIQVATAFCSIVNGGEYYRPTIVAGTVADDGSVKAEQNKSERRTVSEATSGQIRDLLAGARGSTWLGSGDRQGYSIGGKTGTAETISSSGEYTASETVATYIGFGGADEPEYVIMVRVAAPGKGLNLEGDKHAGPIFSDISNWMIDYMKIAPKG